MKIFISMRTIHEVKKGVKEYVSFYNQKRPHHTLGYQKPMDVYNASINLSSNQEVFWAQLEGRLMVMLENEPEISFHY